MRGRSGVLHTGHALLDTASGRRRARRTASTTVHFADLTDAEIAAYVATGEPLHVAGAFTIDGLGGAFVTGIEGDHHNVVGLSLPLVRELVAELGRSWVDLWRPGSVADVGHHGDLVRVLVQLEELQVEHHLRCVDPEEHELAEQEEPRRVAERQPDHVGRDVVGDRVVETHPSADPQAGDRDEHRGQVDDHEGDDAAVRVVGRRSRNAQTLVPRKLIAMPTALART